MSILEIKHRWNYDEGLGRVFGGIKSLTLLDKYYKQRNSICTNMGKDYSGRLTIEEEGYDLYCLKNDIDLTEHQYIYIIMYRVFGGRDYIKNICCSLDQAQIKFKELYYNTDCQYEDYYIKKYCKQNQIFYETSENHSLITKIQLEEKLYREDCLVKGPLWKAKEINKYEDKLNKLEKDHIELINRTKINRDNYEKIIYELQNFKDNN